MYSIGNFLNVGKLAQIRQLILFCLLIVLFFLQLILEIAEGSDIFIFFLLIFVGSYPCAVPIGLLARLRWAY